MVVNAVSISLSEKAVAHFSEGNGYLATQTLGTLDLLYDSVEETEEKFKRIGKFLEEATQGKFVLGPVKERSRAEDKIATDYAGKATLITDIVRAKIIVYSPEAIDVLRNMLDTTEDADEYLSNCCNDAYCAQMRDYFSEPKLETGYRAINAKIAIPLDEEGEFHLVELQVVHHDIEAIYDKTHKHMVEAQKIAKEYRNEQIPNDEAFRMAAHYAVCRYENGCAAKHSGLDALLKDQRYALTKEEAGSLKYMIQDFRFDY